MGFVEGAGYHFLGHADDAAHHAHFSGPHTGVMYSASGTSGSVARMIWAVYRRRGDHHGIIKRSRDFGVTWEQIEDVGYVDYIGAHLPNVIIIKDEMIYYWDMDERFPYHSFGLASMNVMPQGQTDPEALAIQRVRAGEIWPTSGMLGYPVNGGTKWLPLVPRSESWREEWYGLLGRMPTLWRTPIRWINPHATMFSMWGIAHWEDSFWPLISHDARIRLPSLAGGSWVYADFAKDLLGNPTGTPQPYLLQRWAAATGYEGLRNYSPLGFGAVTKHTIWRNNVFPMGHWQGGENVSIGLLVGDRYLYSSNLASTGAGDHIVGAKRGQVGRVGTVDVLGALEPGGGIAYAWRTGRHSGGSRIDIGTNPEYEGQSEGSITIQLPEDVIEAQRVAQRQTYMDGRKYLGNLDPSFVASRAYMPPASPIFGIGFYGSGPDGTGLYWVYDTKPFDEVNPFKVLEGDRYVKLTQRSMVSPSGKRFYRW